MANAKKKQSLISFKKARGQINNIIKMIEEDKYCVDIMTQNLAVIGLLKSAHRMIMEGHLNGCFLEAIDKPGKRVKKEKIKELLKVIRICGKR